MEKWSKMICADVVKEVVAWKQQSMKIGIAQIVTDAAE